MEYPDLVLDERVNQLNLQLIGVHHTPDFFETYENFFREQIDRSPAMFIEDTNSFEFKYGGFYGELTKIATSNKPIPVSCQTPQMTSSHLLT